MGKASDFLKNMSKTEEKISGLEVLASTLSEEGDRRLSNELEEGASSKNLTEALLALALNLHQNGDDRLWDELGLSQLIKESKEIKEKIDALSDKKSEAKISKSSAFLSSLGKI